MKTLTQLRKINLIKTAFNNYTSMLMRYIGLYDDAISLVENSSSKGLHNILQEEKKVYNLLVRRYDRLYNLVAQYAKDYCDSEKTRILKDLHVEHLGMIAPIMQWFN